MMLYFSIVNQFSAWDIIFSFSLLLDSGHGGQTKDLIGDKADGFEDGYSFSFKLSIIANTNDIYSHLSRKFLAMRYLCFSYICY